MDIWRPILVGRKDVPIWYYKGFSAELQGVCEKKFAFRGKSRSAEGYLSRSILIAHPGGENLPFILEFISSLGYNEIDSIRQKSGGKGMMISTKGRYALRVMVDLAEHQGEEKFLPLNEIAQRQEISEKYLENILKSLVRAGLLRGIRGKGGGYRLTRRPEEYSIGTILRLTEGDLAPVACLASDASPCPRKDQCATLPMWCRLNRLIQQFFDGISLADLMEGRENPLENA